MAKQTINIGSAANDGTGDGLRTAFNKVNANFTELYNADAALVIPTDVSDLTDNTNLLVGGDGEYDSVKLINTGITEGEFSGSPYTFVHNNNGNETDQLSTNVIIARGVQGGLFNSSIYETYDDATNGHSGQQGFVDNIEWNSDGWGDLSNVTDRTYEQNWRQAVNANPPASVNREFVIHNTDDDTYHTLKFTAWQNAAAGGGFSYIRRLINTSTPYLFTKSNYGNEVDYIDADVAITRGDNQAPYNPLVEEGYDYDVSPVNTQWNGEGWADLSNVTERVYTNLSAVAAAHNGYGPSLVNRELVMKDTVNNKYYKIKWLQFTGNNNGGGFQYTRELIDDANPATGVKFADNTVQNTAYVGNIPQHRVKENYIDYYIKMEDANKHLYIDQNLWVYVPEHQTYPLPIGTTVVIVTKDNNCTIGTDGMISIYAAGFNSTGAWDMPARSMSTLLKVEDNVWMLSGPGLTQV